jgi:hypothetical protein
VGTWAHRSLLLVATTCLAAGCTEPEDAAEESASSDDPGDTTSDPSDPSATTAPSATTDPSGTSTDPTSDTDDSTTGVDEDIEVVPLRVEAFNVPTLETYYGCFEFSFQLDQLGHVVGFVPHIDDVAHVHHFVLSRIDGPSGQSDGYSCFDLEGEMVWTWAPGGGQWDLPPEAGFLIGDGPGGEVTFRLQIHYNNPLGDAGVTDSSGLDLLVSKTLRPNNAGTMVFGDIEGIEIPPGVPDHLHVSTCSGNATSQLLDEPMHVFGTAMHAHELGAVLWGEVHDGAGMREINRDEPYLFDSQHMKRVDEIINPGDEVQTHCIYDSTNRTEVTIGGPGTGNEMCWNVVNYWPRVSQPVDLCGTGS